MEAPATARARRALWVRNTVVAKLRELQATHEATGDALRRTGDHDEAVYEDDAVRVLRAAIVAAEAELVRSGRG